jgi:4-amino-4-deoxy-L-arabinose transferase-like glycosyltransferase
VALGLGLYLPGLGAEILRHPLEARYALAAREMLRGGPLLVAHLFGQLYPDKPPLYFWVTALLGWLEGGRIGEVTARLPAALAALAGLVLTYRLGDDLFGRRAGLLAALVLATSNLFFWYARQGHPDQFLTMFVTLACLGLWRVLGSSGVARSRWLAVAYVAMGLGVLSKGLLGLALPLLAGLVYAAATGPLRAVAGRLRLGAGLGLFLVVVLAWYGPAVLHYGTGYLYETLIHQHAVRYARTWAHKAPWYYYFGEFPSGFFPWVLFLPGAFVLGSRPADDRAGSRVGSGPRSFLFPMGWFVAGFIFFSFSSGKRGAYLLPLYPAAALMVGWLWDRMLARGPGARWIAVPLAVMSGTAALLAIGLLTLGLGLVPRRLIPGRMVHTLVPGDPRLLGVTALFVLAGAATVWLLWARGRPAGAFAALVAVQAVLLLTVATVRAPQYEAEYPVRAFASRVHAAVPPGRPVFSLLYDYDNLVAFYLDRPIRPLPGPSELLAVQAAGGPHYGLVDNDELAILEKPGVSVLAETQLGPKRVVLIRLDARSAAAPAGGSLSQVYRRPRASRALSGRSRSHTAEQSPAAPPTPRRV